MSENLEIAGFVRAIKELIQDSIPKFDTMVVGTIVTTEPLSVDMGNNMTLTEEFLFLGQMCRPHKVTIPHSHLIDAHLTESTKAVNTKQITAGAAVDVPQNTATYDVKTQSVSANASTGLDERTLSTETKSGVDLGGATFSMSVDVSGSVVSGSCPTGAVTGAVTATTDMSQFGVSDDGHVHIIAEHETQDVHFPGTDYEESVTIEICPRLKIGDKVLMFAFNNGQRWYVAERLEEVS